METLDVGWVLVSRNVRSYYLSLTGPTYPGFAVLQSLAGQVDEVLVLVALPVAMPPVRWIGVSRVRDAQCWIRHRWTSAATVR